MTVKGEVLAIETLGDAVRVTMQVRHGAEWRPYYKWVIEVPEHTARRYRIGDMLRLSTERAK